MKMTQIDNRIVYSLPLVMKQLKMVGNTMIIRAKKMSDVECGLNKERRFLDAFFSSIVIQLVYGQVMRYSTHVHQRIPERIKSWAVLRLNIFHKLNVKP